MILGLVAGAGSFPLLTAKNAKVKNAKVVSIGFRHVTADEIERLADKHLWLGLGELSKMLTFFKKEGVQGVILAGTVDHAAALNTKDKLRLLTDPRALKLLLRVKEKKAGYLLRAIIEEIEKEGMRVLPSFTYLEKELLTPGVLSKEKPDEQVLSDIETGWRAAKTLAQLDIGLTVCVAQGAVIAAEAMEGTDACIKRAGDILRQRQKEVPWTIVKVARTGQDPRFDLPVIGPGTIETAKNAGAQTLAAEASWTLLLDRQSTISAANRHQMVLYGIESA